VEDSVMSARETFIVLESLVVLGIAVIAFGFLLLHRDSMDKNKKKGRF
jgi:hypothetical protein